MAEATDTNRFGLDYLTSDQAQKVDAINQALAKLNANAALTPDVNLSIYAIDTYWPGTVSAGKTIYRRTAVSYFYFPASMAGSRVKAGVAATASAAYTLKKNGTTFCTVTFAAAGTVPTYSASALTSFVPGDELTIVGPAGADATLADIGWNLAARLPVSTSESVSWASVVNCTANGNTLTKTAGGTAWDAGAASTRAVQYGDAVCRFKCPVISATLGLSLGNSSATQSDIDFGIVASPTVSGGSFSVVESGLLRITVAGVAFLTDIFEVRVNGTAVEYWHETAAGVRTLRYTSPIVLTLANYPLLVDVSIDTVGAKVTDVSLAGVLA